MNGKLIIHETRNMINSIKIEISRIFTIIKVSITICYQNFKFRAALKCEISTNIIEKRTIARKYPEYSLLYKHK